MKQQAFEWWRTDRPLPPKRPKRDLKEDVIYTSTGIVDFTRRRNPKRQGSRVERILLRL